jgi:WD40 repeat protein
LWNIHTGDCEKVLAGHNGWVVAVCLLGDGRIASGSWNGTVRIWNIHTEIDENPSNGHTATVTTICRFPHDHIMATGSEDGTVGVWDALTGECMRILRGHTSEVVSVIPLPDGRLASGSKDTTARVWKASTGSCIGVLEGHTDTVRTICPLSASRLVTGSDDGTVRIWTTEDHDTTCRCERVLTGHVSPVAALALFPENRLASISFDRKTLRMWASISGDCLEVVEGEGAVSRLVSSIPTQNHFLSWNRVPPSHWKKKTRTRVNKNMFYHEDSIDAVYPDPVDANRHVVFLRNSPATVLFAVRKAPSPNLSN